MAISAGTLLGKASKILLDETNVRWPVATEMIGWLDSAQRDVFLLKPELLTVTAARQLVAGTKQTLPAGSVALVNVTRNMGAAGTTPGRAIRPASRSVMDMLVPDWHSAAALAEVKYFLPDPQNPKVYHVYPPQPATGMGYVEEVRNISPTAITDTSTNISLEDVYEGVLINLVLSYAFLKDNGIQGNLERAVKHRAMALEVLGIQAAVEGAQ